MALINIVINSIPNVKSIGKVMFETGASRATIEQSIIDDDLDCAFAFSGKYVIKGQEKEDKGYKVIVDNDKYERFKVWCENNPRIHR